MLIIQPDLHPQFAILGLLIGIVYVTFAYAIAYFGGGGLFCLQFSPPCAKNCPIIRSWTSGRYRDILPRNLVIKPITRFIWLVIYHTFNAMG